MEKHLILTGADSAACSDIIKTALGGKLAYAGGYVTEAEYAPNGAAAGARAASGSRCGGHRRVRGAGIPALRRGRWTHDNEVFLGDGVRLLQEAQYYPFTVADAFRRV